MKISLSNRDLKHNWHPAAQMKDYEQSPSFIIQKAKGSYIELVNGQRLIDAISSWWCKSLGHNHPRLKKALRKQLQQFEHVIFCHTTCEPIVALSERLSNLVPSLNKVFYASDGSSAIEIALKMSLHARKILEQPERKIFLSLANGYHGETIGALSVSQLGLYKMPYQDLLFPTVKIELIPYVNSPNDPLWTDAEEIWQKLLPQLKKYEKTATALILEPLVQGAGNMKIYSADFLKRLATWAKLHDIHLIADEIMTGIGRLGDWLASSQVGIKPDFVCLSKGLTSGFLPLSAVLIQERIYDVFYDDYAKGKNFLHSHTYSGHALAASVALETMNIIEEGHLLKRVTSLGYRMKTAMEEIARLTGKLTNVRQFGALVAADMSDLNSERPEMEIFQRAVQYGAYLRPLGNTLYWLPPLNIEFATLDKLTEITYKTLCF